MKQQNLVIMVIGTFIVLSTLAIALLDRFVDKSLQEHALFTIMFVSFAGLRTVIGLIEAHERETPLKELAYHTGLTYQRGSILLGSEGRVTGNYRGHPLTISMHRQIQTRIELLLHTTMSIDLRMRGPYKMGTVAFDKVAGNMFRGTNPYQIGDQQFLIKSQPASIASNLVAPTGMQQGSLRGRLPMIQHRLDVRVEGCKLSVEYTGMLEDANALLCLFDVLSDLADVLERSTEELTHSPCRLNG